MNEERKEGGNKGKEGNEEKEGMKTWKEERVRQTFI